ncbi:MAG: T9SS type A sorting domain-containing protein, partial [Bacteroidia bacterium]|nr:T9SS type A sorting domain-containing protein [Bacteroidia bacterium]
TGASYSTDNLTIATSGSHKSVFTGYWLDAFLVKFDNNGVRQWGTFYGGITDEGSHSCAVDNFNNVYICGYATPESSGVVATPGSHQPNGAGGVYDAFLAKFNSNGVRQWGTYYGGTFDEAASSCVTDNSGNVYMTGNTSSSTGIASAGCHQNYLAGNYDAFLVKFNSNGVKDWGTYYGSTQMEMGQDCAVDLLGNVYLAGYSGSPTSNQIATPNSHQDTSGGNFDAFLIKFTNQGVRQWGTYYGGAGMDCGMGCTTDSTGNIYLCGFTNSLDSNSISTIGSHQINYGGGSSWGDAFITKFNSSGTRIWGTYYGGPKEDWSVSCAAENNGNVYLIGTTNSDSTNAIATNGSFQETFGGGISDAFVAAFDLTGQRISGTYYGARGREEGEACVINKARSIFIAGVTDSNTSDTIASVVSHQNLYGGGQWDGFLARFNMCEQSPTISIGISNTIICLGETAVFNASGVSSYAWNTGWAGATMSVSPISNTSYTVSGKDIDGCEATASISLLVTPCTSIGFISNSTEEIKIYPVPSQDHTLYINRSVDDPIIVKITNTLGAIVLKVAINVRDYKFDLRSQPPGIYFVEISGSQHATKKIILN